MNWRLHRLRPTPACYDACFAMNYDHANLAADYRPPDCIAAPRLGFHSATVTFMLELDDEFRQLDRKSVV